MVKVKPLITSVPVLTVKLSGSIKSTSPQPPQLDGENKNKNLATG